MTPAQLSIAFFLQAAVILIAARAVGFLAQRWLGQPRVVGEMIAGVMLGPSLFGLLAPEIQAAIFPAESKPVLFVFAQLGVGLYMFVVGLEFRREEFRANLRGAASVSIAGMAAPFVVAVALAPWLLSLGDFFTARVTQAEATLFLGAAIAITAFPMLARIIHERGLTGTRMGTLALSAGAIDDAGAWTLIAIVLASLGSGPGIAVLAIGGGLSFALFCILVAPRLLPHLFARIVDGEHAAQSRLALALILFALAAWAMDAVGMHAVFGGFLLGTAMPRGAVADEVRQRLEPVTVVLLLPFFFTYSGLNTQLTLVGGGTAMLVAVVVLIGSIAAKGGACYLAARLTGTDRREAAGIGALMNARGLMELIVINIGLQAGIITPTLFAVLVVMAIVTTLMTSPLFWWFHTRGSVDPLPVKDAGSLREVVADGQPEPR
jgi:Kef-type K+ transport system membrane component KefB